MCIYLRDEEKRKGLRRLVNEEGDKWWNGNLGVEWCIKIWLNGECGYIWKGLVGYN